MIILEENVKALNALITTDNTLKAMALFYAENVSMQENEDVPRVGKQVCIDHEKKNLDNVKSFKLDILNQAIDAKNQVVFSEYYIEFETLKGLKLCMKEVSIQNWENGQIVREKFYYKNITPVQ
jgi:predicted DNA-binding protein YlxM (UPF0122 family)